MKYMFKKDGQYLYDKNTNQKIVYHTEIDVAKFIKANNLGIEFLKYLVIE